MKYNTTQVTWWIAHGMGDKIHSGVLPEGEQLRTGQPNFETFNNRMDWENRLMELNTNLEYLYDEDVDDEEDIEYFLLNEFDELDHVLYMDQVDHLLYGDKQFRHVANPSRREDT
jgi:hypothetical protein